MTCDVRAHPATRGSHRARRHRAAVFLLALLAPAACFSSDPVETDDGDADVTIEMTGELVYEPAAATVRVGDIVRWVNVSNVPHTVTADPDLAVNPQSVMLPAGAAPFDSGLISPGGAYTHTFSVPGTYRYFCRPHEGAGMIATIVVTE